MAPKSLLNVLASQRSDLSEKIKILIVDDDISIINYLKEFLENEHVTITSFEQSEIASEFIDFESRNTKRTGPLFDVAFIDLKMPNLSGLEFCRKLRKHVPSCTVVLMSAFGDIQEAVLGIKEGAYDYIEKPFTLDRLGIISRNVLTLKQIENSAKIENTAFKFTGAMCKSPTMTSVYELVRRAAPTSSNVMITGESGVGKELIARAIHENSTRATQPFVSINCSAIPENLLESELFGHSKGSFTGAHQERAGLFTAANGGTLFLDEIGDLSLPLQAKLLRVVQERKIRPVGSDKFHSIDVRLVSATNKNLNQSINDNLFREDLFYRLNVIPIHVPPLRQRKEDIIILANHFLKELCEKQELKPKVFSTKALEKLLRMPFKGNVRELQNTVERSIIFSDNELITDSDIPSTEEKSSLLEELTHNLPSLKELENMYIKSIMDRYQSNKQEVAKVLGLSRRTLYRRLEEVDKDESSVN